MASGLLGLTLAEALRSDFFCIFRLREVRRTPRRSGGHEVELRPEGPEFRSLVRLVVHLAGDERIEEISLEVARSFLEDRMRCVLAHDMIRSLVLAAAPAVDRKTSTELAHEILARQTEFSGPPILGEAGARPPTPPGSPSPAWETLRGRLPDCELPLRGVRIRLANVARPEFSHLQVHLRPPVEAAPAPAPAPATLLEPVKELPTPKLVETLEDADRMRAYDAAWALWPRVDPDLDAHAWIGEAGSGESGRRAQAALGLGRAAKSAPEAIPILTALTEDPARGVRICAALALGMLEKRTNPETVAALGRCLGDPDPGVRIIAANALRLLGPRATAAVPSLMRALSDEKARYMSARALSEMGAAARGSVEPLEVLAGRKAGAASDAAAEAVRAIRAAARKEAEQGP